ncbi:MAG: hypothetical protein LAE24_08555 [Candidatus Contendobacter sp.]|jgi:hypothetical protein|nr:hypothetical protein [Candidatus Contendobacter sp.]
MNCQNLLLATLPWLLATPALAVNKCVDANDRVSYQNGPCPTDAHGGEMNLNINRSFAGESVTTPSGVDSEQQPQKPAQDLDSTAKPRAGGS